MKASCPTPHGAFNLVVRDGRNLSRCGMRAGAALDYTSRARIARSAVPAAAQYPTGSYSISVAVGKPERRPSFPDLAVANCYSHNVCVLFGQAGGSLAPAVYYATGTWPTSVTIADLNGDALLDLAVSLYGDESGLDAGIDLFFGYADGTFAPPVRLSAGPGLYDVAVADFNGDQLPDLATISESSANVIVWLGLGGGAFGQADWYTIAAPGRSLAVADLNGDQVPDIVAISSWNGEVAVLLGAGDGTFSIAGSHPVGRWPNHLELGDLNADGIPDLVTANADHQVVAVALGLGDGSFAASVHYPAGEAAMSVAIGDLTADGIPDLAVTDYDEDERSRCWKGSAMAPSRHRSRIALGTHRGASPSLTWTATRRQTWPWRTHMEEVSASCSGGPAARLPRRRPTP